MSAARWVDFCTRNFLLLVIPVLPALVVFQSGQQRQLQASVPSLFAFVFFDGATALAPLALLFLLSSFALTVVCRILGSSAVPAGYAFWSFAAMASLMTYDVLHFRRMAVLAVVKMMMPFAAQIFDAKSAFALMSAAARTAAAESAATTVDGLTDPVSKAVSAQMRATKAAHEKLFGNELPEAQEMLKKLFIDNPAQPEHIWHFFQYCVFGSVLFLSAGLLIGVVPRYYAGLEGGYKLAKAYFIGMAWCALTVMVDSHLGLLRELTSILKMHEYDVTMLSCGLGLALLHCMTLVMEARG